MPNVQHTISIWITLSMTEQSVSKQEALTPQPAAYRVRECWICWTRLKLMFRSLTLSP